MLRAHLLLFPVIQVPHTVEQCGEMDEGLLGAGTGERIVLRAIAGTKCHKALDGRPQGAYGL